MFRLLVEGLVQQVLGFEERARLGSEKIMLWTVEMSCKNDLALYPVEWLVTTEEVESEGCFSGLFALQYKISHQRSS